MLGVEPAVPVDFCVIEAESALFIPDFDVQIWVSGKELVGKSTKDTFSTNIRDFVDYSANDGVLVQNHGGDDMFVGKIMLSEIEMRLQTFSELAENKHENVEWPYQHDQLW